jgi:hypothetical protein
MPHQSVRRYRSPRVKMTRLGLKFLQNRAWSAAEPVTLNYRRPLKTGNIVQTSVNALVVGARLEWRQGGHQGRPRVRHVMNETRRSHKIRTTEPPEVETVDRPCLC